MPTVVVRALYRGWRWRRGLVRGLCLAPHGRREARCWHLPGAADQEEALQTCWIEAGAPNGAAKTMRHSVGFGAFSATSDVCRCDQDSHEIDNKDDRMRHKFA